MSQRVTPTLLEHRAGVVNAMLRDGIRVEVSRRNGATALDKYDRHGLVDMLIIGTAREVYTYLRGMIAALEIVGR